MATKGTNENIGVTYYDQNVIQRILAGWSLRKIKVTGLIALGILTMGITGCSNKKDTITDPNTLEASIDDEEEFMMEQLEAYSIAFHEYKEAKDNEKIEKRVKLVEETRNLNRSANTLIAVKVKDALGLHGEDIIVDAMNTNEGKSIIVVSEKSKYQTNDTILYHFENIPKEITIILSQQEELNVYSGSGENEAWEKGISSFVSEGNRLYEGIVDLVEKDLVFENDKLKITENEKNY